MKIAIVGAGKLGQKIMEACLGGDSAVTLVDTNDALLQKLSNQFDLLTITANAKDIGVLKEMEIHTYDYLIAALERDEDNILICTFAKKLGCRGVIARIREPEHVTQISFIKEAMNIDHIVNPDMAIAAEIYRYLVVQRHMTDNFFSGGRTGMVDFDAERFSSLIGKTVRQGGEMLEGMHIVALSRNGKVMVPKSDVTIQEEDCLFVAGKKEEIIKLSSLVQDERTYTDLRSVMIVGGGNAGFYLAQKLSRFGVAVKIVEIDREQCEYLSEHLQNVLVINGDATDMNLLEEENFSNMDAFVATTGYDEDNLLLALTAKQHGIEDVVAKISRRSYSDLTEKLGIDMALNPLDIVAGDILSFMKGSARIVSSQLIQGQAEIIELIADGRMRFLDTPLVELNLPQGVKLIIIVRNDEVILPGASTEIREGDKVVIFSLLTAIPALENLLRAKGGFFR